MKPIIMSVVLLALSMAVATMAVGSAEVKRVCTVDEKTKKEVCKNVNEHNTVEGTPVPEKPTKK
jgi:Na+-transporting methylmalonyl-CoA/oxaloacetate decarboxylase gamma subunit